MSHTAEAQKINATLTTQLNTHTHTHTHTHIQVHDRQGPCRECSTNRARSPEPSQTKYYGKVGPIVSGASGLPHIMHVLAQAVNKWFKQASTMRGAYMVCVHVIALYALVLLVRQCAACA